MKPFDEKKRSGQLFEYDMKLGSINKIPADCQPDFMNLNMVNVDPDEVVYRIYSLDRFLELAQTRQNTLVNTKLWEDPFENFLLGCQAQFSDGRIIDMSNVRDSWYGQCWSYKEECDGLWRTNTAAKTHRAIKVKTTIGRLFQSFYDFTNQFHSICYFIGKIEYIDKNDILTFLKTTSASDAARDTSNISQMRSLLFKRKEFGYEQEVRLLYCTEANGRSKQCVFQYGIDPNVLFDEIVIDPWATDSDVQWITNQLQGFGITIPIIKSDLYSQNKAVILFS